MSSRSSMYEYNNNNAKRKCIVNDINMFNINCTAEQKNYKLNKSILSLPYHIQHKIINNMDIVDTMLLNTKIHNPHIKSIVNDIKQYNVNYTEKQKTEMLIKAFESLDINIIEMLFNMVKYTSIDKINIDNNTFNKIIEICYYNNFTSGIDFLAKLKDIHYVEYKNYTDNEENQYELVSQYIVNNSIEPHKIFLQLIISNNNLELFNYVERKYSYGISLNFNDYKNQIFNNKKDFTIAYKIKNNLINCSNSYGLNQYYDNELKSLAAQHNIIF